MQREHLIARHHDLGPEKIIPAPNRREYRQHGQSRRRQRQDHLPINPPLARPVNPRRIQQFVRYRQHILPQQEDAGRRADGRDDDADQLIIPAQRCDEQEGRHEDHRERDHQRTDDEHEDQAPSAEAILAQRESRHAVDEERQDGRRRRHGHAIRQIAPEVETLDAARVIIEAEAHTLDRLALVQLDLDDIRFRVGRIDHLRFQADAPDLHELRRRAVFQEHVV